MSHVQANGNWYEGSWREGKKSGRGKLYYPDKGQLYEGFWVDGDAKCGTLSDFGRDEAAMLTKFPIPQVKHFKLWKKSNFLISKTSIESIIVNVIVHGFSQLQLADSQLVLKEALSAVMVGVKEE